VEDPAHDGGELSGEMPRLLRRQPVAQRGERPAQRVAGVQGVRVAASARRSPAASAITLPPRPSTPDFSPTGLATPSHSEYVPGDSLAGMMMLAELGEPHPVCAA